MAESGTAEQWVPSVRRIGATNVGEKGKMSFITALIGERRFDEAATELQAMLDANPRSYIANIQLGRLLEHDGKHDLAVERFETARAANPTQADAAALAGGAYLRLKDFDRAREAFDAALNLDPKRATSHLGLAQVHFHRNELDLAKARSQQAIAFDPQLKPARSLLARIHMREGDVGETKVAIEELLAASPDRLRPTLALARIHMQAGEADEALSLLETAAVHHEDNAQIWAMLGRAKLGVLDYAGAEEALRKSLAIDPRQRELLPRLVEVLILQGKLPEARATLGRLPEAARRGSRVHAMYGQIHMAAQNYTLAAESYRAALLQRAEDAAIDGEPVVPGTLWQPNPGATDWKAAAEHYEAALKETRRPQSDAGEGRRRTRSRVRRQAGRAA
jgi:tetratricopeptide (TPR) repeat protein